MVARSANPSAAESSRELAWIRSRLLKPLPIASEAAVIATNLQGRVAYWNTAAERLYGWLEADALGQDIMSLTPAEYSRDQSAAIMSALQTGEAWGGEILLRRRDGAAIVAFVLDLPVGDFRCAQGAIVGLSGPVPMRPAIERLAGPLRIELDRRFAKS